MLDLLISARSRNFGALHWAGDGPTTVLLHGFLDQAGAWEGVATELLGDRWAFDHRGHGRSDHNPPGHTYFFQEYLADLEALLDFVSPGHPVVLVGHSMGGTMASLYAGARPDRVSHLVLLDGLGVPDGVDHPALAGQDPVSQRLLQFMDGVKSPPAHRPMADVAAAAAKLQRSWPRLDPAWCLRLATRGTRPHPGGVVWGYDPAHRLRTPAPYRHAHHVPLLRRITCPVLSLHPEFAAFDPNDVATIEASVPHLHSLTIPGTTHGMHLEAPGEIARAVTAFLTSAPRRRILP